MGSTSLHQAKRTVDYYGKLKRPLSAAEQHSLESAERRLERHEQKQRRKAEKEAERERQEAEPEMSDLARKLLEAPDEPIRPAEPDPVDPPLEPTPPPPSAEPPEEEPSSASSPADQEANDPGPPPEPDLLLAMRLDMEAAERLTRRLPTTGQQPPKPSSIDPKPYGGAEDKFYGSRPKRRAPIPISRYGEPGYRPCIHRD